MTNKKKREQLNQELKSLTKEVVKKYQPGKIFLFGSFASNKVTADSDLDLLLIKNSVPKRGADRIREVWSLLSKGYSADILVYKSSEFNHLLKMGDPFLKEIIRQGKLLYES